MILTYIMYNIYIYNFFLNDRSSFFEINWRSNEYTTHLSAVHAASASGAVHPWNLPQYFAFSLNSENIDGFSCFED